MKDFELPNEPNEGLKQKAVIKENSISASVSYNRTLIAENGEVIGALVPEVIAINNGFLTGIRANNDSPEILAAQETCKEAIVNALFAYKATIDSLTVGG